MKSDVAVEEDHCLGEHARAMLLVSFQGDERVMMVVRLGNLFRMA